MKIFVFITTHNRHEKLKFTLEKLYASKALAEEKLGYQFNFQVIDDRSNARNTINNEKLCEDFGVEYKRSTIRYGKINFWKMHNKIFRRMSKMDFDYAFSLQDDFNYDPDFFTKALTIFQKLEELYPKTVCLNLRDDRVGKRDWTIFDPKPLQVEGLDLFKIGWIDMIYLANRKFFNVLNYKVDPIPKNRWTKKPKKSSGVGEQMSIRMVRSKNDMFQLKNSLVSHIGKYESQMNRHRNKRKPV